MSLSCGVCRHASLDEIDRLLVAGATTRGVAGHVPLSKSAIDRHKRVCLPKRLAKGRERADVAGLSRDPVAAFAVQRRDDAIDSAESLREYVQELIRTASSILADARKEGDNRTALAALRESRDTLTLLAKASGWLADGGTNIDARSVNLFPNWRADELRAFIAALPSADVA
jgi:hypothetical protein